MCIRDSFWLSLVWDPGGKWCCRWWKGRQPMGGAGQSLSDQTALLRQRTFLPRADHLLEQVNKAGAAGVVLYRSKFCDSEQVEWPYLRDRLEEEGIPVTLVEGEHRAAGFEQTRTRLEAFREALEDEDGYGEGGRG